jgi:hypothetical protein
MKLNQLRQLIREEISKVVKETQKIELNTSFLQSQDDFEI